MWRSIAVAICLSVSIEAQAANCEEDFQPMTGVTVAPEVRIDPMEERLMRYVKVEARNQLSGLASYYSTSLDGTLTANGERFRNRRLTAAHLTLPLGSWVEIRSIATGKTVRVRVNDRGPYSKFTIDLSQAAARAIGVDVAEDRSVAIRIIALPGEKPLSGQQLTAEW